MDNIIHTKIGRVELMENGILRVTGNSNIHITLESMHEIDKAYEFILKERTVPFLIIFGDNATIDPDAQEYFSSKRRANFKKAEALVTTQTHHKIIALYHTKRILPSHPVKHFSNQDEAIQWLNTFR